MIYLILAVCHPLPGQAELGFSASTSPNPGTTRKGEAAAVLFQSRTKVSFILSGYATFRFATSVSVLRRAGCARLVRAHLTKEKPKAGDCFITWLSLTSGEEALLNSAMAWSLAQHVLLSRQALWKNLKPKRTSRYFTSTFPLILLGRSFGSKHIHSQASHLLSPPPGH